MNVQGGLDCPCSERLGTLPRVAQSLAGPLWGQREQGANSTGEARSWLTARVHPESWQGRQGLWRSVPARTPPPQQG